MGILVYKYTVILYHYFLSANFREYLRGIFIFVFIFLTLKLLLFLIIIIIIIIIKIYQAFENCLTSLDFLFQIVFL